MWHSHHYRDYLDWLCIEDSFSTSMSRDIHASPPLGRSRTGCGTERNGIRSMVVLRELMSGPLRADIMVSFGKPARPSGCAGSKQGQRAAGGRTPLDGRHLDRPEPAVSLLQIEIYLYMCVYMYMYPTSSKFVPRLVLRSAVEGSRSRQTRSIDRSRN